MAKGTMVVSVWAMVLLGAVAGHGAQSPGQRCEALKNQEAGKYAACLHKAEAKLLKTRGACSITGSVVCYGGDDCPAAETCDKDLTRYAMAVSRCKAKFVAKWQKLEDRTSAKGASCPDGLADGDVMAVINDCVANVAGGLAGGDFEFCRVDLAQCTDDLGICTSNLDTCSASLVACNGSLATCTTNLGTAQSGTAGPEDVLTGRTFASEAGLSVNGAMANNGTVNITPGTLTQTIAEGYHDGSGTVAGDEELTASNIRTGVEIFGVTGTYGSSCGNGIVNGGEDCDLRSLNGSSCVAEGFVGGTLACNADCRFDSSGCYLSRFVDNEDGTISDFRTGLIWEKKVELDSVVDSSNPHDADNRYSWVGTCSVVPEYCQPDAASEALCLEAAEGNRFGCSQCAADAGVCEPFYSGATIWEWVATLNAEHFGGYSDWRVPTRHELESILDLEVLASPATHAVFHGASCGSACTDVGNPACSCTATDPYWSASTLADPFGAWVVLFQNAMVDRFIKVDNVSVRAVRGPIWPVPPDS